MKRRPVIGVMGSGREAHDELAAPLGRYLAERGVHLLTGGGSGVMAAVSRAFFETSPRKGRIVGVIPADPSGPPGSAPPGYPNPWVEIVIRTHLAARGSGGAGEDSRNHLNVLSSDAVIALPGGEGTASEIELARQYGRPTILWWGESPERDSWRGWRVAQSWQEVVRFLDSLGVSQSNPPLP